MMPRKLTRRTQRAASRHKAFPEVVSLRGFGGRPRTLGPAGLERLLSRLAGDGAPWSPAVPHSYSCDGDVRHHG